MATILRKIWQAYVFVFNDLADQRLLSWPFVGKPYQLFALLAVYLMFVTKWGPKWMKNRKPFNLDKIMIIYNAIQIIFNAYLFYASIVYAWGLNYKLVCEPVDFSDSPTGIFVAKLTYYYFLTKLLDLLDTVFFVLRKKHNQVSFLHLYHHTGMTLLTCGAATYYPGGHGTSIGVLNTFIHVLMYSYYLATVALPVIKNFIWIKKLLTQLQILQFFCLAIHIGTMLFVPDCEYPRWSVAILLPQNLFLTALFTDFYIKTYVKKTKQKPA